MNQGEAKFLFRIFINYFFKGKKVKNVLKDRRGILKVDLKR